MHAQTRKRDLIDRLYRLGLCISYDRVIQISADMGNSVYALYESEKLVCPAKLRKGLLTAGNVDIEVPSLVDGKRRNLARVSGLPSPKTQNHSRVQDSSSFHPRVIEPVSPTIKRRNLHVLP